MAQMFYLQVIEDGPDLVIVDLPESIKLEVLGYPAMFDLAPFTKP